MKTKRFLSLVLLAAFVAVPQPGYSGDGGGGGGGGGGPSPRKLKCIELEGRYYILQNKKNAAKGSERARINAEMKKLKASMAFAEC